MFVLSTSNKRQYMQIFNQYDRCCYRNRFGELYEEAVDQAAAKSGGGKFTVEIDVTHAGHKVSTWAMKQLLNFFEDDLK